MNQPHLSRREFLVSTTAAATLAAGGTLLGEDPQSAGSGNKEPTLRWGLIGTGTRGTWTHIPVLKEAPESQLIALCDVAEDRLHTAAGKVDKPVTTYADYQKLLANRDVNAVVIAVPNLLHRQMLLDALQAGKHVLCEKPAGATPADADAMQHAAGSASTLVMFGMQYRNNLREQQIHELLESGKIGKPRYLVQNCSRGDWNLSPHVWQYADPKLGGKSMNWRFSHTASGGTLNEFDCHYFDLLHWFVGGLPERIACDGGISVYHDGRDTWDHATVTLKYPGDVTAVHTLCLFGPGRSDLQVMGDEGSIETTGQTLRLTYRAGRGAAHIQEIPPQRPAVHSADLATLRLYQDFLECLKTGKKPDASPARAVAASRTCWLAEMAAERKTEVGWHELA